MSFQHRREGWHHRTRLRRGARRAHHEISLRQHTKYGPQDRPEHYSDDLRQRFHAHLGRGSLKR